MKDQSLNTVERFATPEKCWAKPFVYNEDVVVDVSQIRSQYPHPDQRGGFSSLAAPHYFCYQNLANVKVSSSYEPATHICNLQLLVFPKPQRSGLGAVQIVEVVKSAKEVSDTKRQIFSKTSRLAFSSNPYLMLSTSNRGKLQPC